MLLIYWVSSYQDIGEYLVQCTVVIYFYLYYNDLFPKWEVCWFNKYICLFLFLFTENRKNWKQHIHYLNFLILQLVVTLRICPTWPNSVGYGVPRDHYIVSFQKRTQCTAVVMKGNKKYHILKTVAFIPGKKNPAIQNFFIHFSIIEIKLKK